MCVSSTSGCAFVYLTVQYCIEYSSTISLFKPRVSGSKYKSSSDEAGTAKEHQVMKMETKVNIIEREVRQKDRQDCKVTQSYNMNCSTISMILKNKDKIMEHMQAAVPMIFTIISK